MALLFQGSLLERLGSGQFPMYEVAMRSVYGSVAISSDHPILSDLLSTSGMSGMLGTVWLILSAMAFGGAMEAAGFLATITSAIVSLARGTASLITSTLVACGVLNVTASDQYLAIVVPGRMFKNVYPRERLGSRKPEPHARGQWNRHFSLGSMEHLVVPIKVPS
jgi:NhaC family Na+:H+ antiporter